MSPNQYIAPNGYRQLKKSVRYHKLAISEPKRIVLLVSFLADPKPSYELEVIALADYTKGLGSGQIVQTDDVISMPPWLSSLEGKNLERLDAIRINQKVPHRDLVMNRHQQVAHILECWPAILTAHEVEKALNKIIRSLEPKQNETRVRLWFFTYLAFGHNIWTLLPDYFTWPGDQSEPRPSGVKRGRPSKDGKDVGFNCDSRMAQLCVDGYRKHMTQGATVHEVYAKTMDSHFGCIAVFRTSGDCKLLHPLGEPFPSIGQYWYHVKKAVDQNQLYIERYGKTRARGKHQASKGSYCEEVAYSMEKVEADAYTVEAHPKSIVTGSAAPRLYVVRLRCSTSGAFVGIGFGAGAEDADAYKAALFCACVDKVYFCSLFGITIKPGEWPTVGLGLEYLPDRGSGSCDAVVEKLRGLVASVGIPPTSEPQSHGSIESSHPRNPAIKGIKHYRVAKANVIELARACVLEVLEFNRSADCTGRMTVEMTQQGVTPTPLGLLNYYERLGRNAAQTISRNDAIRLFTTPVTFMLQRGWLTLESQRYSSPELESMGILSQSRDASCVRLDGYALRMCARKAWVFIGLDVVEVEIRPRVRGSEQDKYVTLQELEEHGTAIKDGLNKLQSRKAAATLSMIHGSTAQIGTHVLREETRAGTPKVRSASLGAERRILNRKHSTKPGS